MPVRLLPILACLAALPLSGADLSERDRILLESGPALQCYVYHERRDRVLYKSIPSQPNFQDKRWSDVRRIVYHGMDEGYYAQGMRDKAAGDYAVAAQRFQALVGSAQKEWQRAYGLFQAGECWELDRQYEKAADSFGQFVETLPEHRFYADALYRQGINLARAKNFDAAKQVADKLDEFSRGEGGRDAESRANAITAAVAAMQGDYDAARGAAFRITLSAAKERDTWAHWNSFWAKLLSDQGKYRDAAAKYQDMLEQVSGDPILAARLALGYGVNLAKAGSKDRAILALMRLDALPYGSPEQRLEARAWLGRMMWETAAERAESDDPKIVAFAQEQKREARRVLRSVLDDPRVTGHPQQEEVRAFLDKLPKPEGADDEAEAGAVEAVAPAAVE